MGPVMQGGQLSQNHWTIYMLTSATGSVQLNMQLADSVSDRGKLVVKEHAYVNSNTAVQFWDIPARPNTLAGTVYNLILSKGRHRYNMTEGGVGCRWWVFTVLRDFAASDLVEAGKVDEFLPNLSYNFSRGVAPITLPMKQGSFY
ncbi:hypothetical protein BU23DRAFT_556782 [Bimuria novae-zelandiae CBS 107.79]|uniref:DUF7770 domain-containing protein n=1 Tax=Bimuria novae-zelandiae CBS 107.79 TaxID=1447943 RepID=A0A6A5V116_9PLEO|nr:hypothetical protein BU23DRAFT_556782 [Bimuria novae-zelandiae CBS 107.79]